MKILETASLNEYAMKLLVLVKQAQLSEMILKIDTKRKQDFV